MTRRPDPDRSPTPRPRRRRRSETAKSGARAPARPRRMRTRAGLAGAPPGRVSLRHGALCRLEAARDRRRHFLRPRHQQAQSGAAAPAQVMTLALPHFATRYVVGPPRAISDRACRPVKPDERRADRRGDVQRPVSPDTISRGAAANATRSAIASAAPPPRRSGRRVHDLPASARVARPPEHERRQCRAARGSQPRSTPNRAAGHRLFGQAAPGLIKAKLCRPASRSRRGRHVADRLRAEIGGQRRYRGRHQRQVLDDDVIATPAMSWRSRVEHARHRLAQSCAVRIRSRARAPENRASTADLSSPWKSSATSYRSARSVAAGMAAPATRRQDRPTMRAVIHAGTRSRTRGAAHRPASRSPPTACARRSAATAGSA